MRLEHFHVMFRAGMFHALVPRSQPQQQVHQPLEHFFAGRVAKMFQRRVALPYPILNTGSNHGHH